LTAAWKIIVTSTEALSYGRLIYVVGPSGAGKDSVIAAASKIANKNNRLYFSRRYVTRIAVSDNGDLPVSAFAFAHYRQNGFFALDWDAHGFSYGIAATINTPLRAGLTVVVNGSRAYLPVALAKYPAMTVVHVSVPPQVAHARLIARGRENAASIAGRMGRTPPLPVPAAQLVNIDNSGALETAAQALVGVLLGHGKASAHDGAAV
jgi:ribose 1,5-bisphosphokinase